MKGSQSEMWNTIFKAAEGLEHETVDPTIRQLWDSGNNGLVQSTEWKRREWKR